VDWEQARGPARIRWGLLGLGAALAVALVAVMITRPAPGDTLAVRPTARPRPTASAPARVRAVPTAEVVTATAGSGPLLPDGADFTVVAGDRRGWWTIDIASGGLTRWRLTQARSRVLSRAMFMSGDDLIVNLGLGLSAVLRVSPDGRTTRIATQRQAIPTFDDAAVWVHDGIWAETGGFAALVDPDGSIREHIRLPSLTRPAAGTVEGVFVTTETGAKLLSDTGMRPISETGAIVAADPTHVAHATCNAQQVCEIVFGTIAAPDRHRRALAPGDMPGGFLGPGLGAFSGDGRLLALPVFTRGATSYVTIIDTRTGSEVARLDGSAEPFTSALAWSPDSRWLLAASGEGISAWSAEDGRVIGFDMSFELPIQALAVR
jgi:hypothetical protein